MLLAEDSNWIAFYFSWIPSLSFQAVSPPSIINDSNYLKRFRQSVYAWESKELLSSHYCTRRRMTQKKPSMIQKHTWKMWSSAAKLIVNDWKWSFGKRKAWQKRLERNKREVKRTRRRGRLKLTKAWNYACELKSAFFLKKPTTLSENKRARLKSLLVTTALGGRNRGVNNCRGK